MTRAAATKVIDHLKHIRATTIADPSECRDGRTDERVDTGPDADNGYGVRSSGPSQISTALPYVMNDLSDAADIPSSHFLPLPKPHSSIEGKGFAQPEYLYSYSSSYRVDQIRA